MRHVILGASAAGLTAAGELRRLDPAADITVVSTDTEVYSRCMLHRRLAGDREDISFVPADFFAANRIRWLPGETAIDLDLDAGAVLLASGGRVAYDRLCIATGASSLVPPIPHLRGAANVCTLRTLDDVRRIAALAVPGRRAVVIGAGLVGMDAAVALLDLGVAVTLVEMADRILAIQLDRHAADRYATHLERHGATVIVGASVKAARADDDGRGPAVQRADGRVIPCDLVVVAAGVAPNIDFIRDSRLRRTENGRAVAVDRQCRTSVENIFAAGDVTFLAPIWPEAVRQGTVAAAGMAGREASLPDQDWAWTNAMNFFGLATVSYGHTAMADPAFTTELYRDGDVYHKVIHRDGVIHGAIFQGDIQNCGLYGRLIRDQTPIDGVGKPPLRLHYADFFRTAANGEFL